MSSIQDLIDDLGRGGLSKLAKAAGVTPGTVCYWRDRSYDHQIPEDRAVMISRALGIPLHEIRPDIWPSNGKDTKPVEPAQPVLKWTNNVSANVVGSTLTITVDLAKKPTVSKTGKSMIVASTHGFIQIEGTASRLALNVITAKAPT